MNRHVIKGRGEHRGHYLGYEHANGGPGTGYVWVDAQRKAARWEDPRYSGRTHTTLLAHKHNGYFVKLVASPSVIARVEELQDFILAHAAGAEEPLDAHWVHGAGDLKGGCEEATDFCHDCCVLKVEEIAALHPKEVEDREICVDGGWTTDHDSTPFCETCGAKLDGHLTTYGADEEIRALTGDCAPGFNEPGGWYDLERATMNLDDDDPRWRKIAKVVDRARAEEQAAAAAQAALAASPGMMEARGALLYLLGARAIQKAPEPSYRLWEELQVYLALSFDERDEPTKEIRLLRRRLWKEAEIFLGCLGYTSRGSCFKAPYGEYHWGFVVEIEQERLWQSPAFLEGQAYMRHPCPSGDPKWPHHRDANPYPEGSREHRVWDCGYISTSTEAR